MKRFARNMKYDKSPSKAMQANGFESRAGEVAGAEIQSRREMGKVRRARTRRTCPFTDRA
jgi:hypothetical protein